MEPITIRKAEAKDVDTLYDIGLNTPELQVSATEAFMERDEFNWAITNHRGVFMLAELGGKMAGFIYANTDDKEKPFKNRYACLVYLVVLSQFRGKGIAQALFEKCHEELRNMGATHIYGWANSESDSGIIPFMKKQGFAEGHNYKWMDREI